MKKYLILLLVIAFAASMLFMGISCKKEVLPTGEESYEGQSGLTNSQPDDSDLFWSPDGKMVVFNSNRDGNWEIYIMNADGSEQTNLTNNPADDGFPSWSPDGKIIAFQSYRDGNGEIYIMNADGSGLKRLPGME